MDQVLAIQHIQEKINDALQHVTDDKNATSFLEEISNDLNVFLRQGVDYKVVVDNLDESVMITDNTGKVLYVNPADEANTGVIAEEVLGRTVQDIVDEGELFNGGATLDVLKEKKRVFRLATILKTDPQRMGYAIGVPIFDKNGDLAQVVVSSRPIFTLRELHQDFQRFLDEVTSVKAETEPVKLLESADDVPASSSMIGSSSALQSVWEIIQKVAPTDASVLITGESGVGKEVVADEIYKNGPRKDKPFVKVNCASIPVNLLESELFGYEKGAFSGASASGKKGLFEMANQGTLLLDEIGDMPLDLQVKLLRAIQNKEITHVGGTKLIPLDIRFIASTNSDLKKKIEEGTFRRDLFYRLSVIPIKIPSLRERPEDLDDLSDHFIDIYGSHHNRRIRLTDEQKSLMKQYQWPGNIRELENVIEYLTICSSGTGAIDTDMLRGILNLTDDNMIEADPLTVNTDSMEEDDAPTLADSMEKLEIKKIKDALAQSKNLREAGKILGVNASTVSRKIKLYGIEYPARKK